MSEPGLPSGKGVIEIPNHESQISNKLKQPRLWVSGFSVHCSGQMQVSGFSFYVFFLTPDTLFIGATDSLQQWFHIVHKGLLP